MRKYRKMECNDDDDNRPFNSRPPLSHWLDSTRTWNSKEGAWMYTSVSAACCYMVYQQFCGFRAEEVQDIFFCKMKKVNLCRLLMHVASSYSWSLRDWISWAELENIKCQKESLIGKRLKNVNRISDAMNLGLMIWDVGFKEFFLLLDLFRAQES